MSMIIDISVNRLHRNIVHMILFLRFVKPLTPKVIITYVPSMHLFRMRFYLFALIRGAISSIIPLSSN